MTGIAAKLGQPRRRNGGAVPDDWCLFLPCLLMLLFLTAGSTSDFFHMTFNKIRHIIIHSKTHSREPGWAGLFGKIDFIFRTYLRYLVYHILKPLFTKTIYTQMSWPTCVLRWAAELLGSQVQ